MSRGVDLDGVVTYLKAQNAVISLAGQRVFFDTWLPSSDQYEDAYELQDGPAVVLTPRGGGGSVNYAMGNQNVIVRIFGRSVDDVVALDGAVFDAFALTTGPNSSASFYAKDTVSPDMRREEGGQYVMVSTYQVAQVI